MLKSKKEIENWLKKYHIKNAFIYDDLTVEVDGDLTIYDQNIEFFPIQFDRVNGSVNFNNNALIA